MGLPCLSQAGPGCSSPLNYRIDQWGTNPHRPQNSPIKPVQGLYIPSSAPSFGAGKTFPFPTCLTPWDSRPWSAQDTGHSGTWTERAKPRMCPRAVGQGRGAGDIFPCTQIKQGPSHGGLPRKGTTGEVSGMSSAHHPGGHIAGVSPSHRRAHGWGVPVPWVGSWLECPCHPGGLVAGVSLSPGWGHGWGVPVTRGGTRPGPSSKGSPVQAGDPKSCGTAA